MANLPTRFLLFLSSYSPLLLILAIRDSFKNRTVAIVLVVLAIASVIALFGYLRLTATYEPVSVKLSSISSKDSDAIGYIVSYLIPFLDVQFAEPQNAVALGVLFLVIGVLYVNSNMIYTNPILNLFRYHIFEVEVGDGKKTALITRREYIQTGTEVRVVPLGNFVALETQS